MDFSPIHLLLGSALAEREGVEDPQDRTRIAFLGGLFGGSPFTSLTFTAVLARQEAGERPGPTLVQVPNVDDRAVEEARQVLESFCLKVVTREVYSKVTKGFVTSQKPEAYCVVTEGSTVTLYVSRGRHEAPLVDLPNLVGRQFSEAQQTLQRLDFGVVRKDVDDGKPKDEVVAQDPQEGKVQPKIKVALSVSNGPVIE